MKTMKNSGRRVEETKRRLKGAILSLLEKKPLDRIFVKELCELAEIHRSTFYLHYSDPCQLMEEIEQEAAAKISEALSLYLETADLDDYNWLLRWFLTYVEEHADTYRILLNTQKSPNFVRLFLENGGDSVLVRFRGQKNISKTLLHYSSLYWCAGILSVVSSWLSEENRLPAAEMADILEQIIELDFKKLPSQS